jgi:hypothetical protein
VFWTLLWSVMTGCELGAGAIYVQTRKELGFRQIQWKHLDNVISGIWFGFLISRFNYIISPCWTWVRRATECRPSTWYHYILILNWMYMTTLDCKSNLFLVHVLRRKI